MIAQQLDMFAALSAPPPRKAAIIYGSGHYAAGRADHDQGKPRTLPSYFTKATGKNPREWFRGWDDAEREQEDETAEAEAAAERGFPGYADDDENEAGEVVDRRDAERRAWEAERARIAAGIEAARAAGRSRTILWGKAKAGTITWGGAGWLVELFEHDGAVFVGRADFAMQDSGSYRGHRQVKGARTLDEGALVMFRERLDACAREARDHGWQGTKTKQCAQLAAWIIEQCPPLLYGVDLAAEYQQLRATYTEREKLRCAAICAGAQSYLGEDGRDRSIYSL